MTCVQLDAVDTRFPRPFAGLREGLRDLRDVRERHFVVGDPRLLAPVGGSDSIGLFSGDHVHQRVGLRFRGNRGHPHLAPGVDVHHRRLATVHELHGKARTVVVHGAGEPVEARDVGIARQRGLLGGSDAVGKGDPHRSHQQQARTAPRPGLEVVDLLLGDLALGARLVVAHGAHQDAVAQPE